MITHFRTVLKPLPYDFKISYQSKLIFMGSCFSEHIGNILKKNKLRVDINPFGILFNPVSVLNSLRFLLIKKEFTDDDLFFSNEYWHSFLHHSKFSDPDKNRVLKKINERIGSPIVDITKADFLFITFGTARVYEFLETSRIVSNCHKLPNFLFRKRLIDILETVDLYDEFLENLFAINPNVRVFFSVSPVRHIKDGFTENFLSKSILRLIIENLINKNSRVHYFPAYEIVNDDLRDYRFYDMDMIHPSESAVNYIFEYFSKCFFDEYTLDILSNVNKIVKSLEHIPFDTTSLAYGRFKENILNEISILQSKYVDIDFSDIIVSLK